ncbi:MAG: hypothetical protein AVO35_06460 [Candidatus Aegiribacteria sp. MLS_C]|nr:MAG: hypothetical protein AVO35_06460 [Candidatus Aegiribacteria sp. MLS_C]
MRILDLNSSYSPSGGGIRVYHERKLEYFATGSDHESALAVPCREDGLLSPGPPRIYGLKSVPLLDSGYRMVVGSGGISSILQDYRPDIVEVGSPYLMPRLARIALGNSGIPVVGFYHTDFPDSYVGPYAEKFLPAPLASLLHRLSREHVRRTYSGMTAVFAASGCMLAKLRELGVRNLFHTPLGVDTEVFSPGAASTEFRKEMGVPQGGSLVLYLARLHWEKGLDMLLEAYPLFRDPARLKLVIGGQGPHSHLVDRFIRRYPEVARLPFLRGREEVARVMASSDVFLALGSYETFGLAGLEAISCGTVPVFPDRGGSAEMARSLGLLEPYVWDSPGSLASSVRKATGLSGPEVSGRLREYALSGRSWEDTFRRIEGFYVMILEACRRGRPESLVPEGDWWEA